MPAGTPPPTHVSVAVRYEPVEVVIEVVDDGRGGPGAPGGHGLVGMRERAELYGGRVEAGPRPEGGFRVRAGIPYGAGAGDDPGGGGRRSGTRPDRVLPPWSPTPTTWNWWGRRATERTRWPWPAPSVPTSS